MVLLIGLAVLTIGTAIVAWLKGNLGLVRSGFAELGRRRGDIRTWVALFVPGESALVMFFSAAWQLARPDSAWARWFYSGAKMDRAHALHD
jgi:hypothetical protein